MDDPLGTSLVVTGLGMLILFLTLALLYGLMWLMTQTTQPRAAKQDRRGKDGAERARKTAELQAVRQRAAAIAVALARAEQESDTVAVPKMGGATGDWRALHHQRQLMLRGRKRRAP